MFDELNHRIGALTDVLRGGYVGHQDNVSLLIDDARSALQGQFGKVSAWEQEELDVARAYVHANFLLAAVFAVTKALYVSQLSDDEYWGGYCYTKPQAVRTSRVGG